MSFQRNYVQFNAFQIEGVENLLQEELRGKPLRRKRKKPLYNVSFDGQQVGVESAKEVLELARLSNSIPKVELLPFVDYGSKIESLKRVIATLEAERNRLIEQDDEEIILLMLH